MFFWALLALENAMTVVVVHWIVRLYWRSTAPTGKWALLGNLALDSAAARPAPTGKWALLGNHALDSAAARPAPTGKWALLGNHALDSAAARPAPTGKWALLGNHALDSAAALESGKNKFLSPLESWGQGALGQENAYDTHIWHAQPALQHAQFICHSVAASGQLGHGRAQHQIWNCLDPLNAFFCFNNVPYVAKFLAYNFLQGWCWTVPHHWCWNAPSLFVFFCAGQYHIEFGAGNYFGLHYFFWCWTAPYDH